MAQILILSYPSTSANWVSHPSEHIFTLGCPLALTKRKIDVRNA